MPKLVLRHQELAKARRRYGITTDNDFAERIEVHPAQVSRVLSGKSSPGPRFIAGTLHVFGTDAFSQLFAVVPDDAKEK